MSARTGAAVAALMALGPTARAAPNGTVVLDVDPATGRAARALASEGVVFFTSRARPLHELAELRVPGEAVGTGDLGLVRPLLPLLRAGGVRLDSGAMDLMRLVSPSHFSALFSEHPRLRLFAVRRRSDGSEQLVGARGGGVALVFRDRSGDGAATVAPSPPARSPAPTASTPPAAPRSFVTSFGPLLEATLATTARVRTFDPREGARERVRAARPGHTFVVLRIDRDFGAGEGVVGFLFGSGTLLKPELERLEIRDGAGRRYPLSASHPQGRSLELAYEIPVAARGLLLVDGERRHPLDLPASPARTAASE